MTPTVTPTPTSTAGTPTLRVTNVLANSVRLSWDAAAAGTRYAVRLNGRTLGTVRTTAVRLVGLRPDSAYTAEIAIVAADRSLVPHTAPVEFRTAAVVMPAPGALITLANSLTGGAADVYGARSADGTPVVLHRRHDGANQRWRLEEAAAGVFRLESSATGKCLALALAGPSPRTGTALIQRTCDATSTAQQWRLQPTAYGFALAPVNADLVVGVGGARYYGRRPLVLQTPSQRRYQSWTAVT